MDTLGSLWRSLTQGNGDAVVGKRLLEAIHETLVRAVREHGIQALTSAELKSIKTLCDQLLPVHFQLKVSPVEDEGGSTADGTQPKSVYYQHIYEDETFSMGIFILSPGASLPLHDHPGMSVVSRVLYGSLHVKAYDLLDANGQPTAHTTTMVAGASVTCQARLCTDAAFTAPYTMDLAPDHGNLHEFVAGDERGCAIFDILTPPYDERAGRDCTYYRVVREPQAEGSDSEGSSKLDQVVTLETFDPVFEVRSEPYRGPRLQRYV